MRFYTRVIPAVAGDEAAADAAAHTVAKDEVSFSHRGSSRRRRPGVCQDPRRPYCGLLTVTAPAPRSARPGRRDGRGLGPGMMDCAPWVAAVSHSSRTRPGRSGRYSGHSVAHAGQACRLGLPATRMLRWSPQVRHGGDTPPGSLEVESILEGNGLRVERGLARRLVHGGLGFGESRSVERDGVGHLDILARFGRQVPGRHRQGDVAVGLQHLE